MLTVVTYTDAMRAENVLLGKRIAEARDRRHWTKAELARRASVAPSYVTRIEQGAFDRPSADLLGKLADALGVHISDLTGKPSPPTVAADLVDQIRELVHADEDAIRAILTELSGLSTDEQASAVRFMRDSLLGARAFARRAPISQPAHC